VVGRDAAERLRRVADESLVLRLVHDIDPPVGAQRDLVPGRDHVQVGHAGLRAAEAAVAPVDGPHGVDEDPVGGNLEVRRERLDRELSDPALGVRQLRRLALAGRGAGREHDGDGGGNPVHLSLPRES
jgi:hypothetical protein